MYNQKGNATVKFSVIPLFAFAGLLVLALSLMFVTGLNGDQLPQSDYRALAVCEGVIQLFKQFPDSIWPGYDLAKRPFMFYMPERAFLFNYTKEIDGFTTYPKDWPDLGTGVLVYDGLYDGLSGQLGFGLSLDTVDFAAVPFTKKSNVELFGFIVHENFHEYQQYGEHPAFGEIPWEREQKYPIQDAQNTALAYLEMRLLMDALKAAADGDDGKCRDLTRQFVAVRDHRWKQSDSFVARYEQGQEINEGTARYVEMKSIDLMTRLRYESSLSGLTRPLSEDFDSVSMPQYLLDDFQDRLTGNSVSPEDMPRNRIYPVGSVQGFLLDYLGIDWKGKAQEAGPDFTYAQLLREKLGVKDEEIDDFVRKAKETYGYDEILASTDSLIQDYSRGFDDALSTFEAQDGFRVEIDLSSKNLRRSRSSNAKKWLFDNGMQELCSLFDVYVLESFFDSTLFFRVQDTGLLEENDWDAKTKKMIFFVPEMTSVILDGKPMEIKGENRQQFDEIEVLGKNMKFSCSEGGTIEIDQRNIRISLIR
jgi:hypothetical protein